MLVNVDFSAILNTFKQSNTHRIKPSFMGWGEIPGPCIVVGAYFLFGAYHCKHCSGKWKKEKSFLYSLPGTPTAEQHSYS